MKFQLFVTISLIIALSQVEAIAMGRNVTIQEVPWLVMIKSGFNIYSGVLIEENVVLTLASICNKYEVTELATYMGSSEHLIVAMNATEVKEVHMHPEWGKTEDLHMANVCILSLKTPYKIGKNIWKAALMAENEILPEGVRYRVGGWGPANLEDVRLISKYPTVGEYKVKNYKVSQDVFHIEYRNSEERILYTGDEGGPIFIPEYGRVFGMASHIDDYMENSYFVAIKFTRLRGWIEEIRQKIKTG